MRLARSLRARVARLRSWRGIRDVDSTGMVERVERHNLGHVYSMATGRIFLRKVVGRSMLPMLADGQVLVCWKNAAIRRGDVVIVHHNGMEKIKRLKTIRTHHVYIVGDNRAASTDSRHFGWISRDAVVGRVIWPKSDENLDVPPA